MDCSAMNRNSAIWSCWSSGYESGNEAHLSPSILARESRESRLRLLLWDHHLDLSASSGGAVDRQIRTQLSGTFAHAAHSPVAALVHGGLRIEARSVILHHQTK